MFCRLVYDLLASGKWWDTILADSDRWGARKFTIGPFTAPVWSDALKYVLDAPGRASAARPPLIVDWAVAPGGSS